MVPHTSDLCEFEVTLVYVGSSVQSEIHSRVLLCIRIGKKCSKQCGRGSMWYRILSTSLCGNTQSDIIMGFGRTAR